MGEDNAKKRVEWKGTQTANLVRRCGAVYYAQLKIAGKTYRRSLGTDRLAVARMKLPGVMNEIRAKVDDVVLFSGGGSGAGAGGAGGAGGRETLRGCLMEWILGERARPDLKAATKKFNDRRFNDLVRTLPVDDAVRDVGVGVLRTWWGDVAGHYNAVYANALLAILKRVLGMQVAAGLRARSVVEDFKRMRVAKRLVVVPSGEEMGALIADIRRQHGVYAEESADMVAFMAFTGMRPEEVAQLRSGDLLEDVIAVRMGERGTKNYHEREVPIMAELREVVDRRRGIVGRLWSIKSPRLAMTRACERLKLARVTRYMCRHFFATRCLESGVDVPTVAKWLGHRDGGITLMKTYSHVTDKHGLEAAKRVRLG